MLTRLFIILILSVNMISACAVCYGDPTSPMAKGMNMGVLTLMGFIGFVLCMVAYSMISIFNRSKDINR